MKLNAHRHQKHVALDSRVNVRLATAYRAHNVYRHQVCDCYSIVVLHLRVCSSYIETADIHSVTYMDKTKI
jgi:hypothetical protein